MFKKHKVIFIDDALSVGGSLIVISKIAKNLSNRDYKKIIICSIDEADQKLLFPDACIYRIRKILNYARIIRIQNLYYGISNKYIVKFLTYLLTCIACGINITYYMRVLCVLLREKPDIVHINSSYDALMIASILRKKIVYHLHRPHTSLNIFRRFLFSRVHTFIAVSEFVKKSLPYLNMDKVRVLHNPVQKKDCLNKTARRESLCIDSKNRTVSLIARLVRWKGHIEFLRAMQHVIAKNESVLGMIVGGNLEYNDGYEDEIKECARDLGIDQNIVFTGHVSDVECMYEMSDIVVHTSIEPEAFGLVIIEAMSYGKPVIVSDIGAPSELVENNNGAFIVNPHDTELLADRINMLLYDRDLYKQFSTENCKKAELYRVDAYTESISSLYEQIINPSGGAVFN